VELALVAAEHLEHERAELLRLWHQRRERAAYAAERARRQYDAVEPENRLVARNLERQWEELLAAQEQLEEAYHRFLREQPHELTDAERTAIRALAADIPALWTAPTTSQADRKSVIRQVAERVQLDAIGSSEQVQVTIQWVGGAQTQGRVVRPISQSQRLHTYTAICEHIRTWTEAGWPAHEIAASLDQAGFTPAHGGRFGTGTVRHLRRQLGLGGKHRGRTSGQLGPDEWWCLTLARHLSIPKQTLGFWVRRGWVRARQEPTGHRRWIIWADATEQARLQRLHAAHGSDWRSSRTGASR
jgi:hypothetical protein